MFPYPSGVGLHVGHPKGNIAVDVVARFKMLNGYSVLHPMGWDAFGLPAENYAIKNKVHPSVATEKNIATFKKELSATWEELPQIILSSSTKDLGRNVILDFIEQTNSLFIPEQKPIPHF